MARVLASEALELRQPRAAAPSPRHGRGTLPGGPGYSQRHEAERLYREALVLLERTGANPERQVGLLQGLSTFARRRGQMEEALDSDRQALERARTMFGPNDHRTGYAMIHLADHIRDIREDYAEAERLYRQGMALISRRYGVHHVNLIHGLNSLGSMKSQLGEHDEAVELFRRALAIRLAATGPDNPAVAGQLLSLAGGLEAQGNLAEAEEKTRQALGIWTDLFGPLHRAIATGNVQLASIMLRKGDFEEADRLYRLAIAIEIERPDGSPGSAGEIRRAFGRTLIARGEYQEAELELLESLRALEDRHGPDHPNTVDSRRALMELYAAWDRPDLVERFRVPPGRFVAY
jgi:eukaryotic-like serine/threonine-protein kinase